jgi:hypothetical protein
LKWALAPEAPGLKGLQHPTLGVRPEGRTSYNSLWVIFGLRQQRLLSILAGLPGFR